MIIIMQTRQRVIKSLNPIVYLEHYTCICCPFVAEPMEEVMPSPPKSPSPMHTPVPIVEEEEEGETEKEAQNRRWGVKKRDKWFVEEQERERLAQKMKRRRSGGKQDSLDLSDGPQFDDCKFFIRYIIIGLPSQAAW